MHGCEFEGVAERLKGLEFEAHKINRKLDYLLRKIHLVEDKVLDIEDSEENS